MDSAGNFYVSDYLNHRIRKVGPGGFISTFAGTGIAGYSGDGGSSKAARINLPSGLVIDAAGNVIFSDTGNNRIRKVSKTGTITTIAGTGVAGFSGDGGPATSAMINYPYGLAEDAAGSLFFADLSNQRVRKIDLSGIISTVAGNGTAGFAGDGGPAIAAELNEPEAVLADDVGDLFIADSRNQRIRKVDSFGNVSTFAGGGTNSCATDGVLATTAVLGSVRGLTLAGNALVATNAGCAFIRSIDLTTDLINTFAGSLTPIGFGGFDGNGHTALASEFSAPTGIKYDKAANAFIVDTANNQVRKVDATTQIVNAFIGGYIGDGGAGTQASLNSPMSIAFDTSGNMYVPELYGNRVRKLSSAGVMSTFAGTGVTGNSGDGGPATAATLNFPQAVATDILGNTYIADSFGLVIRKVGSSGTISTLVPENLDLFFIVAMATDSAGNIYAADAGACVVWKITPDGKYSDIAGSPFTCAYRGDGGKATQAWLNAPSGIGIHNGNVYIGDSLNNRVRKIDANGIIRTVGGTGTCGFGGDGGQARKAKLCCPYGLAFDSQNNLYIADLANYRVRKVTPSGIISTLAGTGNFGYNGDGLPATKTNLDGPVALAVSPSGILYEVDYFQNRVREIH
jgi:sugar lactone lactonase YvrE